METINYSLSDTVDALKRMQF